MKLFPDEDSPAGRGLREIGHLATWSVTSAKPGNGVDLLRDGRSDTFWQSDGLQPHLISMTFNECMALVELHVYVDYKLDESYTPNKLSVQAGTCPHDIKEIRVVSLEEPSGWVVIPLGVAPEAASDISTMQDASCTPHTPPLHAFLLQLGVVSNHQNGRDTHVREVRVYGVVEDPVRALLNMPLAVTSPEFSMYALLR